MSVNGVRYGIDAPEVSYDDLSGLLIFTPSPAFTDGQIIRVIVEYAEDMLGNISRNLVEWSFFMDMTAPSYAILEPPLSESGEFMTRDKLQPISIRLSDYGSGLDVGSISFVLNGSMLYRPSALVVKTDTISGEAILTFLPEAHNIAFIAGDTVCFSINSTDRIDYCADNQSDTSRCFIIEPNIECLEQPNPFTPNNDGYNDIAVFSYPYMITEGAN